MKWHYTVGKYLESILRDGFVKPATALVPKGERPIAWFTTSPEWEETANKGVIVNGKNVTLTREQTAERGGGLFRIGVSDDFPLHPYNKIIRESRQHPAMERALRALAEKAGSRPEQDWYGTFHNVSCRDWKTIEHFTPDGWQSFLDEQALAASVAKRYADTPAPQDTNPQPAPTGVER